MLKRPRIRAVWCNAPINSKLQNPPPRQPPGAFELFKIGLLKFPPSITKKLFKYPTLVPNLTFKCPSPKTNVLFLVYTTCIWKLVHSHSIKFSIHTFENTGKFVETLFGEPIAHESNIFPLNWTIDQEPCVFNQTRRC